VSPARRNPLTWAAGLAGLALAGWTWYWFTTNFERRTETIHTGWSEAARRNPFLAAERFLERAGIDASSRPGRGRLRALPPTADTLVVRGLGPLGPARRAAVRDWVEDGGRLIVEAMMPLAPDAEPLRDSLLTDVGAVLREAETGEDDERGGAREVIATLTPSTGSRPSPPIEVGFIERYYLDDLGGGASDVISADGRARLLRYRLGAGDLLVLSDTVFMTNKDIGNHDHALFTALLTAPEGGRVWLLYDSAAPDLPALLWQLAPQALTAAGVLLALLLWHPGGRLGPLTPSPPRARRDLLLHLEAAAELLWRHGRGGTQLTATRERVERAWLRRHPSLRPLPQVQRAAWLAHHTGLDADAIDRAMYRPLDGTDADAALIDATRTLQQLWLKQQHGSNPGQGRRHHPD